MSIPQEVTWNIYIYIYIYIRVSAPLKIQRTELQANVASFLAHSVPTNEVNISEGMAVGRLYRCRL